MGSKIGRILMAMAIPAATIFVVANVGPLRKIFLPDSARFLAGK
jgi:hypothetical protein